jgi:hypothetical protein
MTLICVSFLVKPGTPRDVTFLWQEDKLTVTCTDLVYNGLLYEVQFRSVFDTKWQVSPGGCHPRGHGDRVVTLGEELGVGTGDHHGVTFIYTCL